MGEYAQRFSDAVFAQVFDWQYWLEFGVDDPNSKEIAYTGDIELKSSHCLDQLRQRYEQTVTTRFNTDYGFYTEYRFFKSPMERLNVGVHEATGFAEIRITGRPMAAVASWKAELLEAFAGEVVAMSFNSVGWAAESLGSMIDLGWLTHIRHACLEMPGDDALRCLVACHHTLALPQRASGAFPNEGPYHVLGGADWGVTIRFRHKNKGWWQIDSIGGLTG